MSDKAWLKMLKRSITEHQIGKVEFPGFPSEETQALFVGSSNESTLGEAFQFYVFMKAQARRLHNPIKRRSRFLDFGCGWGRYLRFFWKDVDEENLYGCDVDRDIVDACHQLHVPGEVSLIRPKGSLPYPDGSFDAIMAYSVFTHLPESIHLHWMRELARVARPGCIFCLTLEPRRFLDFIGELPADTQNSWYQKLSRFKPRLHEFASRFEAGDLVFMPTEQETLQTYGDAVVPLAFIEKNWSPYFQVREYVDDPRQLWQAVLVVQRK